MRDPIVIQFNCQGCGASRCMKLEFDGYCAWSFTEDLKDGTVNHSEFGLQNAMDVMDYALTHIGGDKTYQNHLFLCPKCREKTHGIKNRVLAEQRDKILAALGGKES